MFFEKGMSQQHVYTLLWLNVRFYAIGKSALLEQSMLFKYVYRMKLAYLLCQMRKEDRARGGVRQKS